MELIKELEDLENRRNSLFEEDIEEYADDGTVEFESW
jgi:hypothetical protein